MHATGLPSAFIEALALCVIYDQAGVASADVGATAEAVSPSGITCQLGVIAKLPGGEALVVTVGGAGMGPDRFRVEWLRAVAVWNELPPDERKRLWEGTEIWKKRGEIVGTITSRMAAVARRS